MEKYQDLLSLHKLTSMAALFLEKKARLIILGFPSPYNWWKSYSLVSPQFLSCRISQTVS